MFSMRIGMLWEPPKGEDYLEGSFPMRAWNGYRRTEVEILPDLGTVGGA